MEEKWLDWARQLQAMAQSGLAYCDNKYDIERYQQMRDLSVEIMEHYTEAGEDKIRDLFCGETGYQTPKVDVRGAVFKEDAVLLILESQDGRWSLPGGWADVGLSLKENVQKEMREEAGLDVEPTRLVGIFDWLKSKKAAPFAIYKAFMLCDSKGGAFEQNIETEASGFFKLDELPPLSHRVTRETLELCYQALKDPNWQPVVD
jgi:ADP-ribose pyrophosphatase YjhB (NUDIX family)